MNTLSSCSNLPSGRTSESPGFAPDDILSRGWRVTAGANRGMFYPETSLEIFKREEFNNYSKTK
jgi:hypothetical protein